MKDPYVFDFIPFREDMLERDIEQALVRDVTKLLLELGTGFAFLGNQYHLNVGGDDFYIDLLFYILFTGVMKRACLYLRHRLI